MVTFLVLTLVSVFSSSSSIDISNPPAIIREADWNTYISEDCYVAAADDERELLVLACNKAKETNKEYVVQFNKTENASYYVLCNGKSNAYRIAKNLGIFYSNYGLNADANVYTVQ